MPELQRERGSGSGSVTQGATAYPGGARGNSEATEWVLRPAVSPEEAELHLDIERRERAVTYREKAVGRRERWVHFQEGLLSWVWVLVSVALAFVILFCTWLVGWVG